jgi:hypothetical protein
MRQLEAVVCGHATCAPAPGLAAPQPAPSDKVADRWCWHALGNFSVNSAMLLLAAAQLHCSCASEAATSVRPETYRFLQSGSHSGR